MLILNFRGLAGAWTHGLALLHSLPAWLSDGRPARWHAAGLLGVMAAPREPVSAWSHGLGFLLSVPGALTLWRLGRGERARQLSLLAYSLSLAACYAASAAFHAVRGPDARVHWYGQLDHIGIYLFIAGTNTPIAWNLMRGRERRRSLISAWTWAVAGTVVQAACGRLPIALATCLYLGMGWTVVTCASALARGLTLRRRLPLILGNGFYATGAVLNVLGWPDPSPGRFGTHEVFHLFVLAGSLAHFWFISRSVVRRPAAPSAIPRPMGLYRDFSALGGCTSPGMG